MQVLIKQQVSNAPKNSFGVFSTRAVTRSGYYLSNSDLQVGTFAVLATAAQAGPAALMLAWAAVSTALAGAFGTIAGIGTAILGTWFFCRFSCKNNRCINQGKGVAFI